MSILIFAEDPGAFNYIFPIVEALQRTEHTIVLVSSGIATKLFQSKNLVTFNIYDGGEAVALMHEKQPSMILLGTSENPDSPALMLISAARQIHIPSISVIDFFANAEYRFRGRTDNPLEFAPDWLLVPDNWTAQEYEAIGFIKERIVVAGHPHYDFLNYKKNTLETQDRNLLRSKFFPGAKSNQLTLIFASELSTGLNAKQYQRTDEYTLIGRGKYQGRTDIVIEELLDAIAALIKEGIPRPYLVLRQHPKEKETDLERYIGSFDRVSRVEDPLELIYSADMIVGMSSMLLLESYMLRKPVLSILPREVERNWLILTKTKSILSATRRDEVLRHLRTLLTSKSFSENLEVKNENLTGATQRIIKFLQEASLRNNLL